MVFLRDERDLSRQRRHSAATHVSRRGDVGTKNHVRAMVVEEGYVGALGVSAGRGVLSARRPRGDSERVEETLFHELPGLAYRAYIVEMWATHLDQREELYPDLAEELFLVTGLERVVRYSTRGAIVEDVSIVVERVGTGRRYHFVVESSRHRERGVAAFKRDEAFAIVVALEHEDH